MREKLAKHSGFLESSWSEGDRYRLSLGFSTSDFQGFLRVQRIAFMDFLGSGLSGCRARGFVEEEQSGQKVLQLT